MGMTVRLFGVADFLVEVVQGSFCVQVCAWGIDKRLNCLHSVAQRKVQNRRIGGNFEPHTFRHPQATSL